MANGADAAGNFYDEKGQFVSITTLFERERVEHSKDHETERAVARETAQRLEREVEQTAVRLEKQVEENAVRLEKAVSTALAAVGETAKIHSEAHSREHAAHERIHAVEKVALDKAEQLMNKRLETMNEFRQSLNDQAGTFISREVFEAYQKEREIRLNAALERVVNLEKTQVSEAAVNTVREDSRRTRVGFMVAVAVLGVGVLVNLVINVAGSAVP